MHGEEEEAFSNAEGVRQTTLRVHLRISASLLDVSVKFSPIGD
jgi:hypothetical protein